MRRQTPTRTLLLAELSVAALAIFHHASLRVRVVDAFTAFGTEVPRTTAVALSPWLIPSALTFSAVLTAAALALPMRRSRSVRVLQLSVTVLASVVIFAMLAALVPIFRP